MADVNRWASYLDGVHAVPLYSVRCSKNRRLANSQRWYGHLWISYTQRGDIIMFHSHPVRAAMPVARIVLMLFLAANILTPAPAHAYSESTVYNPFTGKAFFLYKIYDKDEQFNDDPEFSTYTLSPDEKKALVQGGNYWAEILGPGSQNTGPVYFTVGTFADDNADAGSPTLDAGPWRGLTALAAGLIGNAPDSLRADEPAAQIRNGYEDRNYLSKPAQLPECGYSENDLIYTMVHEIGHALGIISSRADDGNGNWFFDSTLSKWDEHLYDQNGNRATAGARIILKEADRTDPTDFLVERADVTMGAYAGTVYFSGSHVQDVLQGAWLINSRDPDGTRMPGVPINGWENDSPSSIFFEGSHIELINSSMSHQNYRNYTVWMEAELAVLQDIGYSIDRKNFFGCSVYGDGLTLTNNSGYFARNADGSAYVPGAANTASFGLGLHLYGSGNTITQAADLLANGVAGIGARVDGAGNSLTIAPGVRVHGNGSYGTGLLVAYGKDHSITHQGDLSATGLEGIAARFDFGDNFLGNGAEYRGSYIRVEGEEGSESLIGDLAWYNLDGPLVSRFDVTGRVAGSAAAIYISPNALVREINIMRGSALYGDIISKWDVTDDRIDYGGDKEDLVTTLRFGSAPQADGSASANADPDFSLRYDGNIFGANSMRLENAGGTLSYNGHAELLSLTNNAGATIKGNATYALNPDSTFGGLADVGYFYNHGILSPGNSIGVITINGNYQQGPSGLLNMEFAANGGADRLIVNGDSTFGGGLQFQPVRDYYSSNLNIFLQDVIQVSGTSSGSFVSTSLLTNSPTLHMNITPVILGAYNISVSRAANAYSQYAGSSYNAGQAGSALDGIAGVAGGDMQNLFAALDFSSASAIHDALPQLSPAVYDAASRASLDNNRMISSLLSGTMLRAAQTREQPSGDGKVFVIPFASALHQSSRADVTGCNNKGAGILGGAEKHWESGLKAGVHAVFSHSEFDAKTQAGATNKVDGLHLGAHGIFKPNLSGGWYTFGQLRVGMENNDMKRRVSFAGYSRTNESDWQSFVGAALWGAGYDTAFGPVTAGPVANLDYGLTTRPAITEKSGEGSRLHIDSSTIHSLGSNLGAKMAFATNTDAGSTLVLDITATWRHELLDDTQNSKANFVGYSNERFRSKNKLPGRNSMNLQGGVSLTTADDFSVSAQMGGEFLRPGYSSAYGNLSFVWNF